MSELARPRTSIPLDLKHLGTAAVLGLSSAFWPGGTAIAFAALLAIVVFLSPALGVFLAIAAKPAIDCLWDAPVLRMGAIDLNLQSIIGAAVPASLAASLLIRRAGRPRLEVAALTYVGIAVLGLVWSPAKGAGLNDVAKIALPFAFLMGGYFLFNQGIRPTSIALLVASYGAVPAITGGLELCGIIGHPEGAEPLPSGVYRVSGFYHHPLDIAIRCAIAVPFALYLCERLKSLGLVLAMAAYAVCLAAISYGTFVRSALVITVAQIVFWMWMRHHRILALGVVASGLIGFIVVPQVQKVASEAIRPLKEGSVYELGTGRALLYAAQVSAFTHASAFEKVLGRGIHSVQGAIVEYSPIPVMSLEERYEAGGGVGSHNQFLRVTTESGLVGLTVLLLLLWRSFRVCLKGMRVEEVNAQGFSAASMSVLVMVLAYCMALTPLDSPGVTWPLWLILGYQCGISETQNVVGSNVEGIVD